MAEQKFKVGDRVKIVNTQKTCSHLNGSYGTISGLFLSSDGNHYYELDNLSFESRKGKHKCLYVFIASELEHANEGKQEVSKKVEPKKEAFGFKHGDLVVTHDLPIGVSKLTACRVVGYTKNSHKQYMIIEVPNFKNALSIGREVSVRWEHLSGNKYWYVEPKYLTIISPSEISKTIVSHEIEGNKTIVTLSDGSIGIAKCNPEDKFDAYIGLKLATERAYGITAKEEPKVKEVKRKAKVGEYIKLIKKDYYFNEVGDILKVTSMGKIGVCVSTDNQPRKDEIVYPYIGWYYSTNEYVVLENYKPEDETQEIKEVRRVAKVGEYIKIVNEIQPFFKYRNGDILNVIVSNPTTVIAKDIPIQIRHEEYVVLENYKPEGNEKLKLKFKEGDYVFVRNATNGCQGVNGYKGIVTNSEATNGLLKSCGLDTTNVCLASGEIWRVNTDGLQFANPNL